jgi:hypothetical protein
MEPMFDDAKVSTLVRELGRLAERVVQLEKRLDKYSSVLRAVFELVSAELHIGPAALAEKLAAVVSEKAERAQALCTTCNRPLKNKTKCMYCGTERPAESIFDLL